MDQVEGDAQGEAGQNLEYFVVVCPSVGPPKVESFESVEEIAVCMRALAGQDVMVFPFRGSRLLVSGGPMRYLVEPGEDPVPLFDLPVAADLEWEPQAHLGRSATGWYDDMKSGLLGAPTTEDGGAVSDVAQPPEDDDELEDSDEIGTI